MTFSAYKFLRPNVPGFCQIAFLPDGTEVSGDELLEAEFSTLRTKFGSLTPSQEALLKTRSQTARVTGILILARSPNTPDFRAAASARAAKAEYLASFSSPTLEQLRGSSCQRHLRPVVSEFHIQRGAASETTPSKQLSSRQTLLRAFRRSI